MMTRDMPGDQVVRELEFVAVEVARSAGDLINAERPDLVEVAATKSSATDIVTVMDQRAQDHLLGAIAQRRPDDSVMGEEDGAVDGSSAITWVIDPIDGTVNYLYGIPAYAVSVAAVVGDPHVQGEWTPIAGAVYNPMTDEMFHARRGAGAYLLRGGARRALKVRSCADISVALVGTGFGYAASRRQEQADLLTHLLPRVRDIRRIGSAALDLCNVAAGRLDAYYETGLNPWDLAAGWLVGAEAGAVIGGLGGPGSALTWCSTHEIAAEFGALVEAQTRRHLTP